LGNSPAKVGSYGILRALRVPERTRPWRGILTTTVWIDEPDKFKTTTGAPQPDGGDGRSRAERM
jgi:hypothetical protein